MYQIRLIRGATNLNLDLTAAFRGGYMDIVLVLLDRGATNLEHALTAARQDGHIEIVLLLLDRVGIG